MNNNDVVVKTENLVKVLSNVEVIKGCNMTVRQGSIYGFLGANGAGKTTIFKILTGLLTPSAGKVEVLGMDVTVNRDKILRNIGSIIEVPIFYEHLSAEENLSLHLAYLNREEVDISKALEKVGLANTGSQPVSKFSLGMRQRLGIARALVHQPKLLILDEPINGLDPSGIRDMRKLFLDLVEDYGMTILISSHILSEIEQIADTVSIIVDGVVKGEATLSDIKRQYPSGIEEFYFEMTNRGVKIV
ncbi:ATP-binding cassette domain-containing protein [Lysinibacillus sp. G4S2]|uniref:ABC transporter ATP-binding protein n=1 Tax=Lysinibacillus sp. G4S2 TaxID=3055859 RepID=UPI0025A268D0|nr:ATP-binding cassette domain-containing protein [Lysinibacillus sp. G4S2]MDM5249185.1 ATP-binding cassette domain-containing protein [Lysinibacillus sp. G4S2]